MMEAIRTKVEAVEQLAGQLSRLAGNSSSLWAVYHQQTVQQQSSSRQQSKQQDFQQQDNSGGGSRVLRGRAASGDKSSESKVNDKRYKTLVDMGFAGSTVEAALKVHSDVEAAMEWCLMNPDGIAQPPKDEWNLTGAAGRKQRKTKKEKEHQVRDTHNTNVG
jgi:TolA-binding protein